MQIKHWKPKINVLYESKGQYASIADPTDPRLEGLVTDIKVFVIDENGWHEGSFICNNDGKCELKYVVKNRIKEKVKGLIFSTEIVNYNSELHNDIFTMDELEFRKYRTMIKKTYHDSYGSNKLLENRIIFTVGIKKRLEKKL